QNKQRYCDEDMILFSTFVPVCQKLLKWPKSHIDLEMKDEIETTLLCLVHSPRLFHVPNEIGTLIISHWGLALKIRFILGLVDKSNDQYAQRPRKRQKTK